MPLKAHRTRATYARYSAPHKSSGQPLPGNIRAFTHVENEYRERTTLGERVMVWHGWERDPVADPAASDALAAYEVATEAQLPTVDCYLAAVEAWRRAHPDQSDAYARGRGKTRQRCGSTRRVFRA